MDEYKQHFLLRAAITFEGHSITLYEEAHTIDRKEKLIAHQQFLLQFKGLLPNTCRPTLVTDAGFRTTWFKLVGSMGWDWLDRVRNRHAMRCCSGGIRLMPSVVISGSQHGLNI